MARPKQRPAPTPRPSPYAAGPITILRPDARGELVAVATVQPGETAAALQFNPTLTSTRGRRRCAA